MKLSTFFISTIIYSCCVQAQGPFSISEKAYNLKVGLGVRVKTNIRKDNEIDFKKNDPSVYPFPFVRLKFSRIEIEPDKLSFVVVRNTWFEFYGRLHYRGHEYNTPTMGHRHKSIYGGFILRILIFKLKWLHDLQDKSGGSVAIVSALLPFYYTDATKGLLQAGVEFWDNKYIDYYFGIKQNEVTFTRPIFTGKKQQSLFAKMILMRRFSSNWLTRMTLSLRRWDNSMLESPTVKTLDIYDGLLGIVYEF